MSSTKRVRKAAGRRVDMLERRGEDHTAQLAQRDHAKQVDAVKASAARVPRAKIVGSGGERFEHPNRGILVECRMCGIEFYGASSTACYCSHRCRRLGKREIQRRAYKRSYQRVDPDYDGPQPRAKDRPLVEIVAELAERVTMLELELRRHA